MASKHLPTRQMPTRQLHLGPSMTGVLKIVDLPWAHNSENTRYESPFDILPDELLLAIVEFATSRNRHLYSDCCFGCPNGRTALALTKVCRRLNRLATPLLYSHMNHYLPPADGCESLRRSWSHHRQDCKHLRIDIENPGILTKADWLVLNDYFRGYSRVRCLIIKGRFDISIDETWQLVSDILTHMPTLEHLTIKKDYSSPPFPGSMLSSLMKHDTVSRLQALSLWNIRNAGSTETIENRDNMAALRDLRMYGFEKDGGAMERLIRWPKRLRSFTLGHSFYDDDQDYMDLTMLGSWLSVHIETLEEIDIGPLSPSGKGNIFDLTQYRELKSLGLSRYLFSDDLESCESDANLILAPGLEEFYWYFALSNGFFREPWNAFGEREERWLQKLVDVAVSKSSPLKRICVIFKPDQGYATETWPWDHLVRLKEYCRQFGITLHYSRPPFDRGEWMKVVSANPSANPRANDGRDIREYFTRLNLDHP
ncbi:hypothetical protein F4813DRAFT_349953 [Daldinia decipiens]|uniref:uncharacterized protein n=1 Tax=Daldinia decipiens TaxID=326647 RepID=UPI0020C25E62|nr:uncharacterized protein F4813DRAFT_349953 [Daldinia decipiens]KAI1660433.1 hypothetical protein F4813DRAFT_349953 [Daldinia decipiens]